MLSILLSFLLLTAGTTTDVSKDNPVELDPIVVVGKVEKARLSKSVNSSFTILPNEIRNQNNRNLLNLAEEKSSSISISSVKAYGYGLGTAGQGKIYIRGIGFSPNKGTLVLIDGRPDIAGLFGHPLPDTYRSAGLSSADITKGGVSTLYGSNALAGVLDLHSFYSPDKQRYTNFEISGGSYNTVNTIVQHSQQFNNTVVAGWYEYIDSDNQIENNQYFNRSGGFRIQMENVGKHSLFLAGRVTSVDFVDPGPNYAPAISSGDFIRFGATVGVDRHEEAFAYSMRLYNSYGEHSFSDGFNSVDRNNGIDIFGKLYNFPYESQSLSGGVSLNVLGGSAYNGSPFVKPGDFSESEHAYHLQFEQRIHSSVEVTFGGRLINHSRYENHFVYQSGLVFNNENFGTLKLSAGTAYRNPAINESQLFLISNQDSLEPEEYSFVEGGYFKKLTHTLSIEGALFYREGKNQILTVPVATPPFSQFQNSGSYSHTGFESMVRFYSGRFRSDLSFITLDQNDNNLSVPLDKVVLETNYKLSQKTDIALNIIGAYDIHSAVNGDIVKLDNYIVSNMNLKYELFEEASLSVRINNLFDKSYEIVAGYPMPGRNFLVRLAKSFE